MKFSIKDFFSKCDQICGKLQIWSQLLKKWLMKNFIFSEKGQQYKASSDYDLFGLIHHSFSSLL